VCCPVIDDDGQIDSVGRTLLDRLMAHVERVLGSVPAGKARIQLASTASRE
jgi:hypothetical protein